MKVVLAPDSFKGSMTAAEARAAFRQGVIRACPAAAVVEAPVADGGEGTLEALRAALGGTTLPMRVTGPLGAPITAAVGLLEGGRTAVVEAAAASGLLLVPPKERNPLRTTTYGTGELIAAAFAGGVRRCIVGVGGTATTDLGLGAAQALGARFFDSGGQEMPEPITGAALERIARIDVGALAPLPAGLDLVLACDVDNPLLGPAGAAAVYGPQKGAGPESVAELERNLAHAADLLEAATGRRIRDLAGSGAGGGLAGGLSALYGAPLQAGAGLILDAIRFRELAAGASLVLTGEGRLDAQSARGKVVRAVALASRDLGIPVIALAGELGPGWEALLQAGLSGAIAINWNSLPLEEAMTKATILAVEAAELAVRAFFSGGGSTIEA